MRLVVAVVMWGLTRVARGLIISPTRGAGRMVRAKSLGGSGEDQIRAFEEQTGKRVFDALVEYPCTFQLKVIGREDENFVSDIVGYIGRVTATPVEELTYSTTPSRKGTFISVSIQAPVDSAETLYECYTILRQDPRVKVAL